MCRLVYPNLNKPNVTLILVLLDVVAQRASGHTKFINQRDKNYLLATFQEENYRKQFTDALESYVETSKWKTLRFGPLTI